MRRVVVSVPQGEKEIGYVQGLTFFKHVKRSKHLMRKFTAWGIDTRALLELERTGCQMILIHDTESRMIYSCTMPMYKRLGFDAEIGHGQQTFLALAYFNQRTENEHEQRRNEETSGRRKNQGAGYPQGCSVCGGS